MIKFNYFGSIKDENFKTGLKKKRLISCKKEANIKNVIINKTHSMMDWVDLPFYNDEQISEIEDFGKYIQNNYETFVVVGVGGSSLGAKAVYNSIGSKTKGKINIIFLDNVDSESFDKIFSKLNIEKTMFNIITKSGTTIETITIFAYILDKLKNKLGNNYYKNLVITTSKNNVLYDFSIQNNIKNYDIPENIAGRYSVLTPVGLLAFSVMNVNIRKILEGAKFVYENFKNEPTQSNISLLTAYNMYLYFEKKIREVVFLIYGECLSQFGDYFIQLLSESLGKEKTLNNKLNKIFFTPYKAEGVMFQHSLLQMFSEGSKDRLFVFLSTKENNFDIIVPKIDYDSLDEVLPENFSSLFSASLNATRLALKNTGKPSCDIIFEDLTEESVGAFIYFCQLTTAVLGELMQVNAYDQNGVEQEKIYTKTLLKIKGYESNYQEFEKLLKCRDNCEI